MKIGLKQGIDFDDLLSVMPKLTFVFCFFSSFISFKSVGTKEMTILRSFLAFLIITQRGKYYEVCKGSNMHN